MALHLFHLIPQNDLAKAALSLHNPSMLTPVVFDKGKDNELACDCVPITVGPDVEEDLCFTLGNDRPNSDLFLPVPSGRRIECIFNFLASAHDPDKAYLVIHNKPTISIKVMDPIGEEEKSTSKIDVLQYNTRYLENPTQLTIGSYHFASSMSRGSEKDASEARRVRQVAHRFTSDFRKTNWRVTARSPPARGLGTGNSPSRIPSLLGQVRRTSLVFLSRQLPCRTVSSTRANARTRRT